MRAAEKLEGADSFLCEEFGRKFGVGGWILIRSSATLTFSRTISLMALMSPFPVRDYFYYIIMQTYDVGLHSRRNPMEFDVGTRPFASFDAPTS